MADDVDALEYEALARAARAYLDHPSIDSAACTLRGVVQRAERILALAHRTTQTSPMSDERAEGRPMSALIVALDMKPGMEARALVSKLIADAGVRWFKIGVPMLLDAEEGARTANFIRWGQAQMMLDLKLYDTRDTTLRAVDAAVKLGAAMLTIHADCVPYVAGEDRLKIIAVRRLTDGTAGYDPVAWETAAAGFVCPMTHTRALRHLTDKIIVCPGIRPAGAPSDNHIAPATPAEAVQAGADYIVVGRPIVAAPDPIKVAREIQATLHEAIR